MNIPPELPSAYSFTSREGIAECKINFSGTIDRRRCPRARGSPRIILSLSFGAITAHRVGVAAHISCPLQLQLCVDV